MREEYSILGGREVPTGGLTCEEKNPHKTMYMVVFSLQATNREILLLLYCLFNLWPLAMRDKIGHSSKFAHCNSQYNTVAAVESSVTYRRIAEPDIVCSVPFVPKIVHMQHGSMNPSTSRYCTVIAVDSSYRQPTDEVVTHNSDSAAACTSWYVGKLHRYGL